MESVYQQFKDQYHFIFIYTTEAHKYELKNFPELPQGDEMKDRRERAKEFVKTMKLTMPLVVDDDSFMNAYLAKPIRLYVIDDGKVAYKSPGGPQFFSIPAVEKWLKEHTQ